MHAPAIKWLQSRGFLVRTESPLPWGICDVVACKPNSANLSRRLAHGQVHVLGSHLRALLFSVIPHAAPASMTLGDLCARFSGHEASGIERELETLVRRRFVDVTPSGAYRARNGWTPLHSRLLAVELKLRRVTAALGQARRNLAFADESYVGLPMSLAKRMASGSRRRFSDYGVGLIGVAKGDCRVLIASKPKPGAVDKVLQATIVERFWRDFKKGRSASTAPRPVLGDGPAVLKSAGPEGCSRRHRRENI